jgi:excinuclease ABC subunit B
MEDVFKLTAGFAPAGDQPEAIANLVNGLNAGLREQVLLGVTGSGKTFTMANVIAAVNRPTLVLAHNKTLAAQLCGEFKSFFPQNAVEYFVSYYDYYQPEAYIPSTDTYIEKDSSINDEIDKMRHSATSSIFERRDVIVVASVSCIFGLGSPEDYRDLVVSIRRGAVVDRDVMLAKLVDIQYERNDVNFVRGKFRVRGEVVEVFPASSGERAIRVEFHGDEIERITEIDVLTGEIVGERSHAAIYPARHFVTPDAKLLRALGAIEGELEERLAHFRATEKLLEAQRLEQRTRYDLEMLREVGYCAGVENYSRHLTGRAPGQAPYTLIDFFPKDFLMIIDESHQSVPQVRAMYHGDRSRKATLVEYGFRLPSAYDNRPMTFVEFDEHIGQVIYVSATPAPYELGRAGQVVEQIVRPTGLVDPAIFVRPVKGQVDDLVAEIRDRTGRGDRVLVTTLTKRTAENLTDYLRELGIKTRYLHSEVQTLERIGILRDLRLGVFDVLVGINLLREGLDLPEVSLVAILDADKEGYLRSETALIQTVGRAARHVHGTVIMYADTLTGSMRRAIGETDRRRRLQVEYNREHGITPETIRKAVWGVMEATTRVAEKPAVYLAGRAEGGRMSKSERAATIDRLKQEMREAAKLLAFERAAEIRDIIFELEQRSKPAPAPAARGRAER